MKITNAESSKRRLERKANIRRNKKKRKKESKSTKTKRFSHAWRPNGKDYELIQKGLLLTMHPSEAYKNNTLTLQHLWHFKSKANKIRRCGMDRKSKFEAAFKTCTQDEGEYIYPTHEQLVYITKGPDFDFDCIEQILPSGVPYCPDKRLRRINSEKMSKRQLKPKSTPKSKSKSKPRLKSKSKSKLSVLNKRRTVHIKRSKAPISINHHSSFEADPAAFRKLNSDGNWGKHYNTLTLPKTMKLTQMLNNLSNIVGMLDECKSFKETFEEIVVNEAILQNYVKTSFDTENASLIYSDDTAASTNQKEEWFEPQDMPVVPLKRLESLVACRKVGETITRSMKENPMSAQRPEKDPSLPQKKKKRKMAATQDSAHTYIRNALLKKKGSVAGLPGQWWDLKDQLGIDNALDILKNNDIFVLIKSCLGNVSNVQVGKKNKTK